MVHKIDTYNNMACYWADLDTLALMEHLEYKNHLLEKSGSVTEFLITSITYNLQKFKPPEPYSAKSVYIEQNRDLVDHSISIPTGIFGTNYGGFVIWWQYMLILNIWFITTYDL